MEFAPGYHAPALAHTTQGPHTTQGLDPRVLAGMTPDRHGLAFHPALTTTVLAAAMAQAAGAAGVDLRTGAAVGRGWWWRGDRAVGVLLASGQELRADAVVSAINPRTTLQKLVGPRVLDAGFYTQTGHIRSRGAAAKLTLALTGASDFRGADLRSRMVIAPSSEAVERAFNPVKYGKVPNVPVMDLLLLFTAGAPWNLRPIGSDALNLARIEAGFIIANMDFIPADQALRENRPRSPLEMGLGWMIDWDRGHFTGRRALRAEQARGSGWARVRLELPGNISAEGSLLYHNRKTEAGFITAAAWSPSVKKSIALAQVPARHRSGDNLWVEIYALRELQYVKLMLPVTAVERPSFNPPRKRATPPGRFSWAPTAPPCRRDLTIAPRGCRKRPICRRTGMRGKWRRCSGRNGSAPGGWPTLPPARCGGSGWAMPRRSCAAPMMVPSVPGTIPAAIAGRNCAGKQWNPWANWCAAPVTPWPMTSATGGWWQPVPSGRPMISTGPPMGCCRWHIGSGTALCS